jgi:hypothetical protein
VSRILGDSPSLGFTWSVRVSCRGCDLPFDITPRDLSMCLGPYFRHWISLSIRKAEASMPLSLHLSGVYPPPVSASVQTILQRMPSPQSLSGHRAYPRPRRLSKSNSVQLPGERIQDQSKIFSATTPKSASSSRFRGKIGVNGCPRGSAVRRSDTARSTRVPSDRTRVSESSN